MYKISLIFILFFLICSAPCLAQSRPENKPEEESANIYLRDFGRVKEGEALKHKFIFKNQTQKVINIKEVNTSCGCTISKVRKKAIKPGEDTVIEVTFETKGYSGVTKQFIYLHTDDADEPIVRFTVQADIKKD